MSIPVRIWRIIRGRWLVAEEQVRDAAEAAAERELGENRPSLPGAGAQGRDTRRVAASPRRRVAASPAPARPREDPLAADLALMGAPPACDMETLDRIYRERLRELRQEELPGSTVDPASVRARRMALSEAYERLRDAINTTETRFEKLEF
jgi:hypothetical protein